MDQHGPKRIPKAAQMEPEAPKMIFCCEKVRPQATNKNENKRCSEKVGTRTPTEIGSTDGFHCSVSESDGAKTVGANDTSVRIGFYLRVGGTRTKYSSLISGSMPMSQFDLI